MFIPIKIIEKGSAGWWCDIAEEKGKIPVKPAKKLSGRLSKIKYLWLDPQKIRAVYITPKTGTQYVEYDDDNSLYKYFSIPDLPPTAVKVEELTFAEDMYFMAIFDLNSRTAFLSR